MDYGHCSMFLGQPQDRELSARPPVLALCYSKRSCRTPVITTRSLLPSNSCSICSHTPSLSRSFAPSTYSPPILGKPTSVHLRDAQLSEDARGNYSLRKRGSKVSGIRATNRQGVWKIVWLGSLAAIHERELRESQRQPGFCNLQPRELHPCFRTPKFTNSMSNSPILSLTRG